MRESVQRLCEPVRTVAGYHLGWWDDAGRPAARAVGKAIRPALTFACAEVVGGSLDAAMPGALAVELAHNFTLLHDDVMDRGRTRRHRPAAWTVFGEATTIVAGDALLVAAVQAVATSPRGADEAVRLLCDALSQVVSGQCADMAFEHRGDVSLDECVAMAAGKTASLIGCACALGALLAGAEASRVVQLNRFGHHLGVAFQLIDDALGIWGDSAKMGKPVGSDLQAAKKSLPVVAALTSDTVAGRELAELYLRTDPLEDTELARAAALIDRAGARAWTHAEAERQLRAALSCLAAADPEPVAAARLIGLSELITRRSR